MGVVITLAGDSHVSELPISHCVVCTRPFTSKKKHQKLCSTLCKKSLHIARTRVRRIRERTVADELPVVSCKICGDKFVQRQENYVNCGKLLCKRTRQNRLEKLWRRRTFG